MLYTILVLKIKRTIMANYMFVLRSANKSPKVVCLECVKHDEVIASCRTCRGLAVKRCNIAQYYV